MPRHLRAVLNSVFYLLAIALIAFFTPTDNIVQSILLFICLSMIGLAAWSRGSRPTKENAKARPEPRLDE